MLLQVFSMARDDDAANGVNVAAIDYSAEYGDTINKILQNIVENTNNAGIARNFV